MRTLLAVTVALLVAAPGVTAQTPNTDPALQWGAAPAFFPVGATLALVSGDPTKSGVFTAYFSMPDGYRIPPYSLPGDEHVEVKQGVLLVGIGRKLDLKKTLPLAVGDTITAPAGVPHYLAARGATIFFLTVMGPYDMVYVNQRDQPGQAFPYSH